VVTAHGQLGKGLRRHFPVETWSQLECTYVGAALEENWEALCQTMLLFRQAAIAVGEALGYAYPLELDERVTACVRAMRTTEHPPASGGV
jgi:aminoglycoside 6-adenylyltransferase